MCSGVIDEELNGANIVAVPLKEEGDMEIGILTHHRIRGSRMSEFYIQALQKYISWKNAEAFLLRGKKCGRAQHEAVHKASCVQVKITGRI